MVADGVCWRRRRRAVVLFAVAVVRMLVRMLLEMFVVAVVYVVGDVSANGSGGGRVIADLPIIIGVILTMVMLIMMVKGITDDGG